MLRNQVMAPTGLGKCDNASVMTGVGGQAKYNGKFSSYRVMAGLLQPGKLAHVRDGHVNVLHICHHNYISAITIKIFTCRFSDS